MNKKALMSAVTLKTGVITVCGQEIHFSEPPIGLALEYARVRSGMKNEKGDYVVKPDIDGAVAMLIQKCTHTAEGGRLFTDEEAMQIAKGSQRVAAPLLNAILQDDKEAGKNDEAPNADSSSN